MGRYQSTEAGNTQKQDQLKSSIAMPNQKIADITDKEKKANGKKASDDIKLEDIDDQKDNHKVNSDKERKSNKSQVNGKNTSDEIRLEDIDDQKDNHKVNSEKERKSNKPQVNGKNTSDEIRLKDIADKKGKNVNKNLDSDKETKSRKPADQHNAEENREGNDFMMGHCAKFRHNCCFKTIVFSVVLALDAADLIADWLLFRDVYKTQEGLVYGPPEDALIYALLAFSVVGTLTFIFEVVNLWWEIYRENPWINSDLASSITIWVEDIPQLVINILIAVCREEAISYFQLVKASVMIGGVVIRIVVSLIRYCSKKSLAEIHEHNKKAHLHVAYRFIIMIGLVFMFAGSLAVFFLTQFERTIDGDIKFNIPKSMFEGKFDEERYFQNVSIYFHHPVIDFNNDTSTDDVNWMRLISIYDVREKQTEMFKLEFDTQTKTKLVLWQTDATGKVVITDCYTMDKTRKTVTYLTSCATHLSGTPTTSFLFKFEFIPKSIPNLIFGDIKFYCVVKENGVCNGPSTTILTRLSDLTSHSSVSESHAIIHYYRTNSVSQDHHLLWVQAPDKARFYRNKADLIDISSVWQTGFGYCESTGSLAPHIDSDMNIDCSV